MTRSAICTFLATVVLYASAAADEIPTLASLDVGENVRESGLRLIGIPYGLHALETITPATDAMLIGVHGWRSEGYEWIYPLKTMNTETNTVYFYRWDDSVCPLEAGHILLAEIKETLVKTQTIDQVIVVGHSLGGVLVATTGAEWDVKLTTELHIIAAPLGSLDRFDCELSLPTSNPRLAIYQWRTIHELDGAFRSSPVDPQIAEIAGSVVTRLPEIYNGRRLGHNWSVSWVAEKVAAR